MQLALEDFGTVVPRKIQEDKRVVLSERDFEILEFILDMKFVSLEEVFFRFFRVIKGDGEAKNDLWAKKRLLQLEQAKFISSKRSFSEATRYYVATLKAYYVLSNSKPQAVVSKPSRGIDQRTFLHDKLVLSSRRQLENTLKVTSWLSDRKLRSSKELSGGLTSLYVPDGIYTLPDSSKVAFELEIAIKAKSRYQDKIKKYVQLMRAPGLQHKIFDRVHFVCAKEVVAQHLIKETKIYGDLFKVETFDSFFASQSTAIPANT